MSRKPLRVAVVGAGQMGRLHMRVVAESSETELVAVVDRTAHGEHQPYLDAVPRLESVEQLLSGRSPDFAIVSAPTSQHAALSLALLDAGIPVLVEKPIADNVADAVRVVEAARRAKAHVAVGHVERFNPAVQELRARLQDGALGRVFQIHTRRLSPFPTRPDDSGVALDLATHDLDLMCELAGRPVRVSAEIDRRAHGSREDLMAATLRFDSGVIGLLEVNWLTPTKVRQLTVTGERGMFVVDYLNQHLTLYENAQASETWFTLDIFDGVTEGNVTRFAIHRAEPLRAQLEAFVRAVRGEAPVAVPAEQGMRVLELALAAVRAGETGRTVRLGEIASPPP